MNNRFRSVVLTAAAAALAAAPPEPARLDLAQGRTLFVVNYAHLDTQWRWTYPIVVRNMLRDTLYDNFARMEEHPEYVFSWTGAGRYQMFQEYYPAEFQKLKGYVARGQWWPAGNAWEESDVNVPSSESIIRQLLVGHSFFKRAFGTESFDFMLPDCFGFPASLPSIVAHCGIKGFSTQKLTWGSAVGIPFNLGRWEGPDGRSIVAALNAGDYAAHLTAPLDGPDWVRRLDADGAAGAPRADYLYNGTGDEGGAPHEDSMKTLYAALAAKGPVRVLAGRSDALFTSLTEPQKAALPAYKGDLLLTEHSAGSINSQTFMKRLNRDNELLAGAAEKAAAAALALGAGPYPAATLEKAWGLMLRNQFHDLLPGTSQPKAYEYAWNDGFIAARAFQGGLEDAVAAVARGLDTRVDGVPLVVYNPLGIDRTDLVEALVPAELAGAKALVASDARGHALPTQLAAGPDGLTRVLFYAQVPAVGFAVYGLKAGAAPAGPGLAASARVLENAAYRVTVRDDGDLGSVFDKLNQRELLAAPARVAFQAEKPAQFPAWNMDWNDRKEPPRAFLAGPARITLSESGPVRAAITVERESQGSFFRQSYRLGAAGDRVEVATTTDWRSSECSLKAAFPLTVANPLATYNLDLGTIQRGSNEPKKFEVATHAWMDLTDAKGDYGVTVLTGAKYGTDKPDASTLRLTLLYTPGVREDYREMRFQDWGRHSFTYALAGHKGDWRAAASPWLAQRQDQPLLAFAVPRHAGVLGPRWSFLRVSSPAVSVQAIKRAEDGRGIVVRLQELNGAPAAGVGLTVAGGVAAARELDGLERPLAALAPTQGVLSLDFGPYQLRTLGLDLGPAPAVPAPAGVQPLDLPFNLKAFTTDGHREEGAMDGAFTGYPAEMLEDTVQAAGVSFRLGSREPGQPDALACRGQRLALPAGTRVLHLLVAANGNPVGRTLNTEGPGSGPAGGRSVTARFLAGNAPVTLAIPSWRGYLGSWDNRVFDGVVPEYTFDVGFALDHLDPAWLTPARPAWWASHHHAKGRDQIYEYSYMFAARVAIPEGAASFTLPDDPRIKVFAATAAATDNGDARALCPIFPDLRRDDYFKSRFEY